MAAPFSTDINPNGGDLLVVAVRGELDIATVDQFEEALATARASSPATLVIDLRELEFMDSTGLRAILLADQKATEDGLALALIRGPQAVHRVLELTRVTDHLTIVGDLGELNAAPSQPE